jgi:ankyrin repeat protein
MQGRIPCAEALYVEAHAKADPRDKYDNTPLHYAAYYGHYHTARMMLMRWTRGRAAEKLANKRNEAGMTPLYIAAARGDARMCDLLVRAGADPAHPAPNNRTALHEAALSGNAHAVDVLVKGGADANVRDVDQRTPLHYAVLGAEERREVLATLVPVMLALNAVDRFGMTALHYAVLRNFDNLLGMFTAARNGCNIAIVYKLRQLQ